MECARTERQPTATGGTGSLAYREHPAIPREQRNSLEDLLTVRPSQRQAKDELPGNQMHVRLVDRDDVEEAVDQLTSPLERSTATPPPGSAS